jgi:Spy/CpxP family protein refolding chaperone
MKKIIIISLLLFSSFGFAQVKSFESDYVEMLKKDIQENSKQIVSDNLTLTEEQAKFFWPIYDEYDKAYDKLVDERVGVIKDYMMNYYGLDEETGKELITKSIDLKQKAVDIQKKYINKMMKVLPISVVGKFFQIDNRISAIIDIARMANLPLIREEKK